MFSSERQHSSRKPFGPDHKSTLNTYHEQSSKLLSQPRSSWLRLTRCSWELQSGYVKFLDKNHTLMINTINNGGDTVLEQLLESGMATNAEAEQQWDIFD